jgi:hypothetical protein
VWFNVDNVERPSDAIVTGRNFVRIMKAEDIEVQAGRKQPLKKSAKQAIKKALNGRAKFDTRMASIIPPASLFRLR